MVVAIVAVVLVLVLTGGSSQSSGAGGPTPTPDPRVAGLPIDQSLAIEATDKGSGAEDSFFKPDTLTAKAGDVIEITVTNTGSVLHNLRVSGPDKEFDTADDFAMPPNRVAKGKTERLVVKIDQPGTYPFRCDFHPLWQKGTLVLQ
ncbi:MAG TPA: cupredoxin domain-containing protein [Dehalococcoidia bacterium]|nr:cupredoxin domain-containing protein [Dehalococcoidia bacterium]